MLRFLAAIAMSVTAVAAEARPFSFVAYGDTGYWVPRDIGRVERLVNAINAEEPAFAIHVGDFKGYTSCSDEAYAQRKAMFDRHAHPLIMTPGDNDWADCGGEESGGFRPLERLGALRRIFFADDRSLGQRSIGVEVQSAAFPENRAWMQDGVLFATVHVIGPHNGLTLDKTAALEAIERSVAGEQWVRRAFARAKAAKSPGMVLAFQLDPWIASAPAYEGGPVDWLRRAIAEGAADYPGQVLVVHGDSHRLTIDHPLRRADIETGTTRGLNVTRLQVPGWPDHRAVRVDVDPTSVSLFRFGLIIPPDEALGAKP